MPNFWFSHTFNAAFVHPLSSQRIWFCSVQVSEFQWEHHQALKEAEVVHKRNTFDHITKTISVHLCIMHTLRASQEHSWLRSLLLQKQSHRPGLKIFMIRVAERNSDLQQLLNQQNPNCAQKEKGFSLENWKGLWQTRDLLKLLRKRRDILYREHAATLMELLLSIPRWLQLYSCFQSGAFVLLLLSATRTGNSKWCTNTTAWFRLG